MGSTLGIILILGIVGSGAWFGFRHHAEINSLRPPKNHWRQGHRLQIGKPESKPSRQPRATRRQSIVPMTDEDLAELDSAFGGKGNRPEDYD